MSGTGWKNPFSLLAPKRRKASVESSGRQSPFSMAGAGSSPSTSTEGETLDTRIQSAIQYAVSYDTGSQSSKGSRAGKSMSKNASMDSAVMDKSRSMDAATEGKNRSWDSARSATFPFNQAGSLHQAAGGTRPCNISRESSATSASSNAPHTPRHLLSVPTTPIGGAPEPFHRASSAGSQSSLNFSAFLRVGSDPTTRSVHSNIGRTSSMFSHTSSVGSNRARRVAAGEVDSPTRADEPPAKPPKPVPCEDEQSTQAWEGWHSTVPNGILCPLSLEIMSDPVFTCDGHTYDRGNIERWLKENKTSPMTNTVLSNKELVPNFALLKVISSYKARVAGSRNSNENAMTIAGLAVGSVDQPSNEVRSEAEQKELMLIGEISAQKDPHSLLVGLKNGANSLLVTRSLLRELVSNTSPGNACAPSFCAAMQGSDGIDVIDAAMQSQLQDATVQVDGCRILNHLCLSRGASARALLEKDSGVSAILKAMSAHNKNPFVCLAGSAALLQLLVCDKIFSETTLDECAGCLIRATLTHEADFSVATNCIAALKNMLPDDTVGEKIVVQGLVGVVLNIMASFEKIMQVQEEGSGLIHKISDQVAHRARMDMDRTGSLMILTIRNFRENPAVMCQACATLKNISIDNTDVVMQLARNGGIYPILSGMELHRRDARVQARCLEVLCACCSQNNRNCILVHQCKGIAAMMKAMTAHRFDADVTRCGLECLEVLAESQADPHSQYRFKLCDDASVEIVTQAMRDHLDSIEVQRAGCMTLCHFAFDDENEVKVVEMGGTKVIVQALEAHAEDTGLVKAACSALKNMTVCHENKKIVAEEGGVGCVVDALSMHSVDPTVQEQGLWALANLAGHAPNRPLIGESMGVEVAVSAMITHIDNGYVVENGAGLLNLLAADEDIRGTIHNSGGVSALIRALRTYPTKRGVQEQACYALANLSCAEDCRNEIFNEGGFELVAFTMNNFDGETRKVADVALRIFEMAGGEMAAEVKRLRSTLHLQKRVMLAD